MIDNLLNFLDSSPVSFLAVQTIATQLESAGFKKLDPALPFPPMKAGDCFFVQKNSSSIYAFRIGSAPLAENGIRLISAHCDSPTFRIKPHAEITEEGGLVRLNTEVYGGPILSTWFDRPLSIAGRVMLRNENGNPLQPISRNIHVKRPLMQICNLAIHFNRQVNDGVKLSKQKDTLPILGMIKDELEKGQLLIRTIAEELQVDPTDILDFDLYLYDTTPACLFGIHNELISSGRLDDLSMVHAALEALTSPDSQAATCTQVMAIFDNEETGSATKQGAGSPFLSSIIERIILRQGGDKEDFFRCIERSFMVSADNAHAWHPNYTEKYDPTTHCVLGGGPVIKINASQKYLTDADSAAVFAALCQDAGVPYQYFVNHSDVAGGSTLGNILTSSIPLRGVDMGNPILAMHSCRETASVKDHEYCIKAFTHFYQVP